jgi:hypothetical protein
MDVIFTFVKDFKAVSIGEKRCQVC